MNLSPVLVVLFLIAPALPALAQEHNSKVVEAAKKEGKLTVYTSMNQRDATLLVQVFKKRYPFIDGQIFRANSPKLLPRIEAQGILRNAENPHATLLWLEFVGSVEGQKILDERGPYEASVFISGTVQERAARGKKHSVVDWGHYNKIPEYERKIIEAYGFPRAQ